LFNVQAWLLSRIADIARKVKLKNSQDVEGARDLEGVTAELEQLRRQILTNWPWSDLPPPPIDREMIRLLLASSAGITARATRLITRAAAEAIADGTECIDCARLDAMNVRRLSDAA